jgi:hypothetical protein
MSIRVLSAAILLCAASVAAADPTQDALHACAAKQDASERLACFDRVAAAVDALVAAPSAATRPAPAPAAVAPARPAAAAQIEPGAAGSPAAPAPAPSVAKAPPPPSPAVQLPPGSNADFGLAGAQLRRKQQQERTQANAQPKAKPQPLVARVTKVRNQGGVQLTIELDNGQIWRQTDGSGDVLIAADDTVTITPGALGGFLLTNAQRRVVRVKRIL